VKYELIIENNLKKTDLKRVRIKVDPSLVHQAEDLSQCNGYEGYILAETGDVPKVLVMNPDGVSSVMDIPQQFLQMLMSDEESETLRAFKEYICNICSIDTSTPEAELLLNAPAIEDVESILKTVGLTDDELKILYRNFISDNDGTVNEGVFTNLLNKAKQATAVKMIGKRVDAAKASIKDPGAWLRGAGKIASAYGGARIGGALQGLGQEYTNTKNKTIQQAFDNANLDVNKFRNWLINQPTDLPKKISPTTVTDTATKRELLNFGRGGYKNYGISDLTSSLQGHKVDMNKFNSDLNNYIKSYAEEPKAKTVIKPDVPETPTSAPTPTITTGPTARTPEGSPVPGQSRFTTADGKRSYLFTKSGWSVLDPANKGKLLTDPAIQKNANAQSKNITAQWQKTLKIVPKPASVPTPTPVK